MDGRADRRRGPDPDDACRPGRRKARAAPAELGRVEAPRLGPPLRWPAAGANDIGCVEGSRPASARTPAGGLRAGRRTRLVARGRTGAGTRAAAGGRAAGARAAAVPPARARPTPAPQAADRGFGRAARRAWSSGSSRPMSWRPSRPKRPRRKRPRSRRPRPRRLRPSRRPRRSRLLRPGSRRPRRPRCTGPGRPSSRGRCQPTPPRSTSRSR